MIAVLMRSGDYDTDTLREDGKTEEKMVICRLRRSPQKEPTLPAPSPQTSRLQKETREIDERK